MSFEDEKIESVSQELDAAAEKKVVGLEKISPSSILAFESFAGKKSSTVTDPNPYRAMYRESIRGSQETNIGERRGSVVPKESAQITERLKRDSIFYIDNCAILLSAS